MFPKEFTKYVLNPYIKDNKGTVSLFIISTFIVFIIIAIIIPLTYTIFSVNIRSLQIHNSSFFKFNSINTYLFTLVFFFILYIIFEKIRSNTNSQINVDFVNHFRKRLIHNLVIRYKHNFEEPNIGELIPRILSLSQDSMRYVDYMINIHQNLFALILINGTTFFFSRTIGCIFLVYVILYILLTYFRFYSSLKYSVNLNKSLLKTSEYLTDSCSNLLNVYINNQEEKLIEDNFNKFNLHENKLKKTDYIQRNRLSITFILQILFVIIFFGVLYLFLSKNSISRLNASILVILLITSFTVSSNIYEKFFLFIIQGGSIYESRSFLEDFFNLKDNKHDSQKIKITGDIIFRNIYFKYPKSDSYILNNLSFKISSGQRLGILGRSGSGKTTIMKLLIKLYSVDSGTILIDGRNIESFNIDYLRKSINYVNQKTTLYNDTILYNIQYGNNQSREKIEKIIEKYQITVFDSLNGGIDTNVGLLGANISLGMQKMIILLRGILREGNIIIFDEPLTSLDPDTRRRVLKMIKEECSQKTVIVITHDMEIVPYMDKIINITEINNQFS